MRVCFSRENGIKKEKYTHRFLCKHFGPGSQRIRVSGSKNSINMYPPSNILHIANLPVGLEDSPEILKGEISNWMFINTERKMAYARFENKGDAASALGYFHNYNLDGRLIKISFTKFEFWLRILNFKFVYLFAIICKYQELDNI